MQNSPFDFSLRQYTIAVTVAGFLPYVTLCFLLMCIPGVINSFFVVNSMLSIGDMPSMPRNTGAERKPVKAK